MPFYIAIPLALLLTFAWGAAIYIFWITAASEEFQSKITALVPIHLKAKHFIILSATAGILHVTWMYLVYGGVKFSQFEITVMTPLFLLAAAYLTNRRAAALGENLEESREDELKKKRDDKYRNMFPDIS